MAIVPDGAKVKKHHVLYMINEGTAEAADWTRIGKSTESTITMNAETEQFDYIDQAVPTTDLVRYAPSFSHPITAYKGEPDFDFAWRMFYNLEVNQAKKDFLIIYQNSEPTADTWEAWAGNVLCVVDSADWVAGIVTMSFSINGEPKLGTVVITDGEPVFTETVPEAPANP